MDVGLRRRFPDCRAKPALLRLSTGEKSISLIFPWEAGRPAKWQAWIREKQPRLLVIWGKYDPSFDVSEPDAYRRDLPSAEVHVLDAGHFALDTRGDEVAALVVHFMGTEK